VHFHVIPRFPNDVVVISYQRSQIADAEMEEIRKKLSENHAPAPARKDFELDF
jgi:diadenosine tetraphosphate (Ap4A) HIT family hydrolase